LRQIEISLANLNSKAGRLVSWLLEQQMIDHDKFLEE
jgi:hypothetical protein